MAEAGGLSRGLPHNVAVSAGQLGALLLHIAAVVVVINDDGVVVFVSPSVRLALGYEPAMVVGRRVVEFMHPDEEASFFLQWDDVVERPGTSA
ncbi:MAG: PAS domain-containing protein, partial [Aquihabitans sp.]